MIISHKYKFIFIKTRKTAGTSIEAFLSPHCGPGDILTPITPAVASHHPRNHSGFKNHIPAYQVRDKIGSEQWEGYFKFCVERNPWDKVLSFYHFVRAYRYAGHLSLEAFFNTGLSCVDWGLYTDPLYPQAPIVDKVLRYETLMSDLAQVFSSLGIPFDGSLGVMAKSEYRVDRRPYQDIYSAAQAGTIASLFEREIEFFGYRY